MSFSLYTRTSKQTASPGEFCRTLEEGLVTLAPEPNFSVRVNMAFVKHSKILPLAPIDPRLVSKSVIESRCKKIYSEKGLVRLSGGRATYLPFIARAVRKLENFIHREMERMSAYEIGLPLLTSESLFKVSGRDEKYDLFRLSDRKGRRFILSPTYEEAITELIAGETIFTENVLPLRFYQISSKFRDEPKVKYGLIRCKEFVMKDLYCFDINSEARNATYNEVIQQYGNFFKKFDIPYLCAYSNGSDMLSEKSQEFHFLCDFGEDKLLICDNCGDCTNINLVEHQEKCPKCSNVNIKIERGIEVGHAFNIGTVYSEKLEARYLNFEGKNKLVEMSSYGIGVSRIVGAALEILSNENGLRWPKLIAPYTICLIPPKEGSYEEKQTQNKFNDVYNELSKCFNGEIVIDDRTKFSTGKRVILNQQLGFPILIIVGKQMLKETPKFEVICLDDPEPHFVEPSDLVSFISNLIKDRLET